MMHFLNKLKKLKRRHPRAFAPLLAIALALCVGIPAAVYAWTIYPSMWYSTVYTGGYTYVSWSAPTSDYCGISGGAPISGETCYPPVVMFGMTLTPGFCGYRVNGTSGSAYTGPINGPTTYNLSCINESGGIGSSEGSGSASITVYPVAPAATSLNYFNASSYSIPYNTNATLNYSGNRGTYGTGLYLGGYGWLSGWSGSIARGPLTSNTVYSIYTEDSYYGQVGPWSLTVSVAAPPPPVAPTPALSANPTMIDSGATSTLAWSAANVGAGQCSLTAPSSGAGTTNFGSITTGSRIANYYSVNAVVGGWAYSMGGYNGSAYVPTSYKAPASSDLSNASSWSTVGSIPASVALFDEPLYINGNLWNFGGVAFTSGGVWSSAICYVPVGAGTLGAWSCPASLPTGAAQGYSNPVIIGDYIYRFGGYNYTTYAGPVAAVERAPVSSPGSWTNYTNVLPQGLYAHGVAVIGSYVYLFGGYNGSSYLNTIYRASLSSDLLQRSSWTSGGVIPTPLISMGIATDANYAYLIGGHNGSAAVNTVYRIPLGTLAAGGVTAGSWSSAGTLPVARNLPKPLVVDDKLYLIGGWQNGVYANAVYSLPFNDGLPYTTPAIAPWRTTGSPNSAVTWPLAANTTYTLQCSNPYGANSASATVTIKDICTDIAGFQSALPPGCTGPTPAPSGVCIPSGYTYNGSACVLATPPPPSIGSFFGPGRVRSGNTAVLKYTVSNPPASCTITGTNGFSASVSPEDGVQGSVTTNAITANTVFTLTCDDVVRTATVGVTPAYQEI